MEHIIPSSEIDTLLENLSKLPKDEQKEILVKHFNHQSIKSVIIDNKLYDKRDEGDQGTVIRTAFVWSPNSLVPAQSEKNRGKDPGSNIDNEMLSAQSQKKQESVEKFKHDKTLQNYTETT